MQFLANSKIDKIYWPKNYENRGRIYIQQSILNTTKNQQTSHLVSKNTKNTQKQITMYSQKYFYHYIPKIGATTQNGQKSKDCQIIGIIDASYSMNEVWKLLVDEWNTFVDDVGPENVQTVTFDNSAHYRQDPKLEDKIEKHGGGGTTIDSGFQYFEQNVLPKIPQSTELKIIFISDGQDNMLTTLQRRLDKLGGNQNRDISFMCLGVLSGFPTFISMQLRQLYHTGDSTVPSIFLIEYSGQKAFFNKFQTLREFIKTKEPINVTPAQLIYPWEGMQDFAKESQWILSTDRVIDLPEVSIKLEYKTFNVEAVCDIFRAWTQKLQLDCLNKVLTDELTIEFAQITYKLMNDILEDVKNAENINLIGDQELSDINYYKIVLTQQISHTKVKIQGFLKDIKALVDGNTPQKMSQFEAAKLIGLGTIVGKYQQKALALKNIDREAFTGVKQEFIDAVAKYQSVEKTESDSEAQKSVYYGTFDKILTDSTLVQGLNLLNTQYD